MFLKDTNNFTVTKANALTTARTINGTSFNGSANITTANWGTARTLTIGSTGKSVNGSANVTWSLSEIGAAAASHTHNYAGSSSAGGSANSAIKLATARTLAVTGAVTGSASFDGSANASISTSFKVPTSGAWWNGGAVISSTDGVSEVGKYLDFHNTSASTNDYDLRLQVTAANKNTVNLPTASGTLALTSDNVASATKLQNARTINDVSFNGTANITVPLKSFTSTIGNDNTKNYHRILSSGTVSGTFQDRTIILMGSGNYSGGPFGIFKVVLRTNGTDATSSCAIEWIVRKGFGLDSIVYNMINTNGSTVADIFYKGVGTYASINWTVLFENSSRGSSYNNSAWTKYTTNASGTEVYTETTMKAIRSYTSTLVKGSDVTTVNSAHSLATARTINGTSFNGTGNITTANWGTARNIYIADSSATNTGAAVSVNGSGNATLKLPASIKATTFTGALSGNATTATTLATARTINGTSFNGSANITTANWGTARTLTIGSTGKSVNGSANVSWTLSEIGAAAASHTHSYLPLSGGTLTGSVKNSLNTGTWLAGNQGTALLSSTNTAGNFTTLIKSNSTNGYFGLSNYQTGFYLTYTAKTTVDAGTNTTTKQAILLNESGNTTFPGTVTAPTFSGALSGNATTATTATTANNVKLTTDTSNKLYLTGATAQSATSTTVRASSPYMAGGTITATTFAGALSGNATTATTLKTARTINGTSFNGSANITTANWGTARNIYIADASGANKGSAVSVNGGSNPTLKLPSTIAVDRLSFTSNSGDTDDFAYIKTTKSGVQTTMDFYVGNDPYIEGGELTDDKFRWFVPTLAEYDDPALVKMELYNWWMIGGYATLEVADIIAKSSLTAKYLYVSTNDNRLNGVRPYTNGTSSNTLGGSSLRYYDVYCTRGAFNGSDSKLKENIKSITRKGIIDNDTRVRSNTLSEKTDTNVTSADLYNYIKNSSLYSYKYRNAEGINDYYVGIMADDIPDNIFDLVGQYTKTEEEYQKELDERPAIIERYNELLEAGIYDDERKIPGRDHKFGMPILEIKEKALNDPEPPMRLINAPAQTAMLQEVLSIVLNKMETLEAEVQALKNNK